MGQGGAGSVTSSAGGETHLCHQHAELREVWPVVGVAGPALPHDRVQLLRAIGRFLQTLALSLHAPQDLD